MPEIYSLKINLSQEEVVLAMKAQSVMSRMKTLLVGPLRSIAAVYVPYRMFRTTIQNGPRQEERLLAIDAVRGTLDLYRFQHAPAPSELVRVETRNCLAAQLGTECAADMLREKLCRMIFPRGFFRVRGLSIEVVPIGEGVHIPYWVAFRGYGQRAQLVVIDAVRRTQEGAKARDFFRHWLLASDPEV
jgi:hypothetical protein